MNILSVQTPQLNYLPNLDAFTPNTEKVKEAPVQLDARHQAAIDGLLNKDISDAARQKMHNILACIPAGTLENLYDHGLRITITQGNPFQGVMGSGAVALGGYHMITKEIKFSEAVLMSGMGKHVVVHETCHAIDHMRNNRTSLISKIPLLKHAWTLTGGSPMASTKDGELATLYAEYHARGAVEDADQMRNELKLQSKDMKSLPESGKLTTNDGWGVRTVNYTRKNGTETFVIDHKPSGGTPWGAKLLVAAGGAAALGVACGVPALAMIGGTLTLMLGTQAACQLLGTGKGLALGIGLAAATYFVGWTPVAVLGGAIAGLAATRFATGKIQDMTAPKVSLDIPLRAGGVAHVEHKGNKSTVTMPEGSVAFTGDVWSDYAHRSCLVPEYYAEGLSNYLEGGSKARDLRDFDPKMYAWAEKTLKDEFDRKP